MSHLRKNKKLAKNQHCLTESRKGLVPEGRRSPLEKWRREGSRLLQDIRCHTESLSEQQQKDVIYNRNITHFRDSVRPNDSFALPFLSSLRRIKDYRQEKALGLTSMQPFEAGSKQTLNQKSRKKINDLVANPFRLSKINYRWQNTSGLGVKNSCEFECTLRLSKNVRNPEQSTFYNSIHPIRYATVEKARYNPKELICSRQRRLFTLDV